MITDDFIEVLDENEPEIEKIEILDDFETVVEKPTIKQEVISIDRLFEKKEEEIVVDAYEEDLKIEEEKQKKITKIQIGLIVFLIIFATLFYLFGYNLVEPYIKIE